MSYEPEVLRRATERLKQRQQMRQATFEARREKLYQQLPRVKEIDKQLRLGVTKAATAALRHGEDPTAAIQALRTESKSLQQERKTLLLQAGYQEDDLVNRPDCPYCNDTGWRGATMCSCLKKLCAEEQIQALSSLLDFQDRKSTRLNSSHIQKSRMPSSA